MSNAFASVRTSLDARPAASRTTPGFRGEELVYSPVDLLQLSSAFREIFRLDFPSAERRRQAQHTRWIVALVVMFLHQCCVLVLAARMMTLVEDDEIHSIQG